MNIFPIEKFERKTILKPDISAQSSYLIFKNTYEIVNGCKFIETNETKLFAYTIIYYLTKQDNFYNSPLLFKYLNTEIKLDKGLIIVGGFGCGKSSVLKTFQYLINSKNNVKLKFISTVEAVKEYEMIGQENLNYLNDRLTKGHLIIDDLLAEKEASRFGKSELFESILFQRCETPIMTTIITMNYDSENPNDLDFALHKLSRYGGRVFDRILGNYNFIQLKGKSFRN